MRDEAVPEAVPASVVEPIAEMVLACVHREYPNHVSHTLRGDEDARPPRRLTPAFYGSFDWHSAVHGHWCLARLVRLHPTAEFAPRAEAALGESLTPETLAGEVAYLSVPGRERFERPYGLAWLLQLAAELREWGSGRAWLEALVPLEALAATRLAGWLPRLRWPIRSGEHGQSAFAMALALDWARVAGDRGLESLIRSRALDFYGEDSDAPLAYEPSGHDFLSPVLGEADLMRRVLPPREFAGWLSRLLPDLESGAASRWLEPVEAVDREDGKLAHLDGLNLSRAWMLEGIAGHVPVGDARLPRLAAAALRHRAAGLAAFPAAHYSGAHWLGSFAVYLLTRRGGAPPAPSAATIHAGHRAPGGVP